MKSVQHVIEYDGAVIPFALSYSARKRLQITVNPDQSVSVSAPEDATVAEVVERVNRRARWIIRQILYFDRFKPIQPPRRYVSGETHLYLGKRYRLKVVQSELTKVVLSRGYLQVMTEYSKDSDHVKKLVEKWFRAHAVQTLSRRFDMCVERMKRFDLPEPVLAFRKMKTRWGSCSSNQRITLNVELVKASVDSIDYVITHELCHLLCPNHGKDFYRLLEQVLPDWERRKEQLEMTAV